MEITALETFISTFVDFVLDGEVEELSQQPGSNEISNAHPVQHGGTVDHAELNASTLCDGLGGKVVYMVGPISTTYALHSYLINALKPTSIKHASCVGPSFCPYHVLCSPPPTPSTDESHGRPHITPPDVVNTNTALLRYIPSTTLYAGTSQEDARFWRPMVDDTTGVRIEDGRWAKAVGRADIIILGKAPVPAPAWSYEKDGGKGVAWWLEELHNRAKDRLDARSSELLDQVTSREGHLNTSSTRILEAALRTTLTVFLPSVLGTLGDLVAHKGFSPILEKKAVIWHGSWYLRSKQCNFNHGDGIAGGRTVLARHLLQAKEAGDPWNAYHNAQVYMHDRLLRVLLPKYGITYVPLTGIEAPGENVCWHDVFCDETVMGRMLFNVLNRAVDGL
ncbi:hypothetical protein OF83DRAFT_1085824 [Amylostereum chailletii]|nr:hypothetical protein OF83DRAFT_1085824 [Amylostereum chailletii]